MLSKNKKFDGINERAEGEIEFPESIPAAGYCTGCNEPYIRCYCGKACLCLCNDCHHKRKLGKIGVPVFKIDFETKSTEIIYYDNYYVIPKSKEKFIHNKRVDLQLLVSYQHKFGYEGNITNAVENIYNDLTSITKTMESYYDITGNKSMKRTFQSFNRISKATSIVTILKNLENDNYADAFYNVLQEIPYIGTALNMISFVESKEFNQAVYNGALVQYQQMINYTGPNAEIVKEDLSEIMDITEKRIDRINEQKKQNYHNSHCTCHK